ncbi:MAG: hypothetical protein MUE46_10790 [Xanthomonadales bacterium]|jgi:hypothetical protein|nr:hypothetical protein [Xanthomonadales bacterium]
MSSLQDALDALFSIHIERGFRLEDLNPGLDEAEFRAAVSWFPFQIHDEIRELYAWRNGNRELFNQQEYFRFGDEAFFSIDYARAEYEAMLGCWGDLAEINEELGFDFRTGFPFAGLHGSYLLVNPQNGEIHRLFCGAEKKADSLEALVRLSAAKIGK